MDYIHGFKIAQYRNHCFEMIQVQHRMHNLFNKKIVHSTILLQYLTCFSLGICWFSFNSWSSYRIGRTLIFCYHINFEGKWKSAWLIIYLLTDLDKAQLYNLLNRLQDIIIYVYILYKYIFINSTRVICWLQVHCVSNW